MSDAEQIASLSPIDLRSLARLMAEAHAETIDDLCWHWEWLETSRESSREMCRSMAESLRSARDQLAAAKEQIERLLSTLARFADHGYPTYWRDRPTDHVVSHVDWPPAYHELRVSDLLRAHAVHESISKELGR